jgi:chromosome segregation ATPase
MSDIESEEYEIMDFPETPDNSETSDKSVEITKEDFVTMDEVEHVESSTIPSSPSPSPSCVLPHSIICDYGIKDIVETPKLSYVFSTSEYCDNIKDLTGEVNGQECVGLTCFELYNNNWVSNAKMELTLTLNRAKMTKTHVRDNVKDSSGLIFDNTSVSVDTDDVDDENVDFRVITFTYSKNGHFTIATDSVYNWTLRTLNSSEFDLKLSYEPDFFQIIKNLKNSELKTASNRRFNTALQKIYIDQLKKDGDYYCDELKTAKSRIHNLNIDLKQAENQVEYLENECESSNARKTATQMKHKSALHELKDLRGKLNRMKFLKDYYCSETKIAKNKRAFAEQNLEKLEQTHKTFQIGHDTLEIEYTDLEDKYTELKNKIHNLKQSKDCLEDTYVELDGEYKELKETYMKLKDTHLLLENTLTTQGEKIEDEFDEYTEMVEQLQEFKNQIRLMTEKCELYQETLKTQTSTIEMYSDTLETQKSTIESITASTNHSITKYKTHIELKDRDIENLEDIIIEYKEELNKPTKYREDVKNVKADNNYLKNELNKLKLKYHNLKNAQNNSTWANQDVIENLKKEIAYLKGKRINKKLIEDDIGDFHRRGYDMIDWYKNNRVNHTPEFIQFQNETELLFNDVLNYFKSTFSLDTKE